jgi:hypothetical protein
MDFQEVKQVQTINGKEDCEQLTEKQAVLCSTVGFRGKLISWAAQKNLISQPGSPVLALCPYSWPSWPCS